MKKIVLNGPALDSAGGWCDAGTELEIGTAAKAGLITAERAKDLVDRGAGATVAEKKPATAKKARAKKPAPKKAPGAPVTPPSSDADPK